MRRWNTLSRLALLVDEHQRGPEGREQSPPRGRKMKEKSSMPGSEPDVPRLHSGPESPEKKEADRSPDSDHLPTELIDPKIPRLQPNMQTKMNTRKNRGR